MVLKTRETVRLRIHQYYTTLKERLQKDHCSKATTQILIPKDRAIAGREHQCNASKTHGKVTRARIVKELHKLSFLMCDS